MHAWGQDGPIAGEQPPWLHSSRGRGALLAVQGSILWIGYACCRVPTVPLSLVSSTNVLEGALTVSVSEDTKQYRHLRYPAHKWPSLGHRAAWTLSDCDILNPYALISPSIISMPFQFRYEDFSWSLIKTFAQVLVNFISRSSLVHMCYLYIKEGQQVSQAWFALYQATLTASNHLPVFRMA